VTVETSWIGTDEELAEVVAAVVTEDRYALDTEFHRERSYYPRVAVVQLAWSSGIALIDPLTVDLKALAKVLDGPGLAVLHAAQQDLEVLSRSCGTIPARLFDTQLAAGFLGYATPALGNLLAAELQVHLPKGDRLTDWLRRPLTEDQCKYAAADVEYLLALHDHLVAGLDRVGRLAWAEDECEEMRRRPAGPPDPDHAWLRVKDAKALRPKSRGVAHAVAAWRERRAARLDQPARTVLPDLAILGLAQRPPHSEEELRRTRGVEERHVRGSTGRELLAAVQDGVAHPIEELPDTGDDLERRLRPAVTLVSAWMSQLAREEHIDTALLATRNDLTELLAGAPDARLAHGWRADMAGANIRALVEGRAALAFDGAGALRLLELDATQRATSGPAVTDGDGSDTVGLRS
jgi:ribonuclease D